MLPAPVHHMADRRASSVQQAFNCQLRYSEHDRQSLLDGLNGRAAISGVVCR